MEKSLKYPIGKFKLVEKPRPHEINEAINVLDILMISDIVESGGF